MRRPLTLTAALLALLSVPSIANADPNVPDANLAKSILDVKAGEAAFDVKTSAAVLDLRTADSIKPLEEEQTKGSQVTVSLSADVLFDFNKATLTPTAKRRIAALAPRLRDASGTVQVSGHSDAIGAPAYNLTLSRQRAEAVKAELLTVLAATNTRINAQGFGETKPVAPNKIGDKDNPDGRAKNRRVEVSFQKS
ncbi:OmpA family protein [Actinomadura barringtoniae]|uniref:OmpA family protein n=1 Tax=Actinomadura barringtoniae TaxID=1427535 RepID=A0A939PM56_9ACTN|nr:OmpA family protein [Actinomadura barringtoniae]MBO2454618.1 OmpA family protein [Actinomadura barringtoniae]